MYYSVTADYGIPEDLNNANEISLSSVPPFTNDEYDESSGEVFNIRTESLSTSGMDLLGYPHI